MDYSSILLAQKTGYIPRNHFDALFARKIGGAVLKNFPGLPADIVTVNDAAAMPLNALKIAINPVQSGSGDPSPTNIRPISGWTGCNVVVSPTIDAEDGTTYHITFPSEAGTVYGGTLDVTNGELVVDRAMVDMGTLNWRRTTSYSAPVFYSSIDSKKASYISLRCSAYKYSGNFGSAVSFALTSENASIGNCKTNFQIFVRDDSYTDVTTFQAAMAGVQLVYELATPITYQLTPTEVQMLLGTNNIWADTGEIIEGKYFAKR